MDILKRGLNLLFFPRHCCACKRALLKKENHICAPCITTLPYTNAHLEKDNAIERIFWGRLKLEQAFSMLYFNKKGKVQNLMHELKYNGKKELGEVLGNLYAEHLLKNIDLNHIDIIVPVPIHPKKKQIRGYNQSDFIAKGMGERLNIPMSDNSVEKNVHTSSQTNKNRQERWENVDNTFTILNEENLTNKHVLLIDDVLTTGSTIESCGNEILKLPGTKLSVATIAVGL